MRPTQAAWNKAAIALALLCASGVLPAASKASIPREDPLSRGGVLGMAVVAEALSWLGVPYRFGGESKAGVDCSGFVSEVLKASGICAEPPRKSADYARFGTVVEGKVAPGDILVFGHGGKTDHVGIALSEDAFVHAASEGPRRGVVISSLSEPAWSGKLLAARRIGKVGL